MDKTTKWYKSMLEKHGSDQAISEAMRERQKKSRETYKGTGGYHYMAKNDPAKFKKISAKGGRSGLEQS